MKRSRLKPKSKKRAAAEREAGPVFDTFKAEHPLCWHCRVRPTTDIHHLCRGANKAKTYSDRRGLFAACRKCHDRLGDYGKVSLIVQIATKKLRDPEYYDLAWLNKMRGKAPNAIDDNDLNGTTSSL